LILSIVPKSQRIIWMAINTVIAFMLLGIQHDHPEFIPLKHHDATARYVDFAYVYFFTLLIVYFTVTSILDNYNKERLLAVKRAEELEHANQSKTKLFSILAHDLKSPLNSIQNFLEILLEFDVTEQERRTIKTSLLRETKYTKQMLVNLLSWSKSQMDGMKVKQVKLDLAETLDPTLLLQASIAEEKAILLHNRLGSNITLFADHDMLELVVRNLVNNAIKFTPSGGEITISAEIHGEDCWILIRDTGVGIKKSKHKDIFTLQSSSTFGTNNEKGVGLGLVLCKEFITVQQGKIWMESTVGIGTTFFISLRLFK
ncbi:MAG: HAMP domain-containing histidine kinase, partial [Pedobacter sp.]|nr:HAMP domain-containing histidine kinase [Pedobacter sp.]